MVICFAEFPETTKTRYKHLHSHIARNVSKMEHNISRVASTIAPKFQAAFRCSVDLGRLLLLPPFWFSTIASANNANMPRPKAAATSEQACFYKWVDSPPAKIAFYFAVQSGGSFDIDYSVVGPGEKVIMEGQKERQGDFVFTAQSVGEYRFCFNNGMSTFAEKMVDFEVAVENEQRAQLPSKPGASPEQASDSRTRSSNSPGNFQQSGETRHTSAPVRTETSAQSGAQSSGFSTLA
ncbi:hypothetical protein CISG_00559 [Coccidioides immitis RMSCC 3703]|uniref:GOLD domain-containing protein n=1 Tax=Coccidioides immitis RMSCC 3703 TaxID=454286 RepID=A0A0J8QTQ7_COCIT|nr:hypothetical protein CISG_00559 [Coccidioides immitis RMSCC 3703]